MSTHEALERIIEDTWVADEIVEVVAAAAAYREAAEWYRRCLEDVQDGRVVRGLTEAKVAECNTANRYDDAVAALSARLDGASQADVSYWEPADDLYREVPQDGAA
jgi:hypothetical protein